MNYFPESEAYKKLASHVNEIKKTSLRELFDKDKTRFDHFSFQAAGIFLDYSKNHLTEETLGYLIQLAEAAKLHEKTEAMFTGKKINVTEHRSVLHTALRNPEGCSVIVDGVDVMPQIHAVLKKMEDFSNNVRNGHWKGFSGKPITDVVNIGIGGSDLGPKMVCFALKKYSKPDLHAHFVSNIDGTQIVETLKTLNPETTLFIIASKTFTTLETLTNAQTARKWLLDAVHDEKAVAKHFVAVSTAKEKVSAFGIDTANMFEFWDWVGGRYSVWSAIGLSIAIFVGMENFRAFLAGAHEMDEHFRHADYSKNLPIILGLLGILYRNFFGMHSEAIIPYDHYLQYFMAYLQQMNMESNGKSVTLNSSPVTYQTGPVIWGGVGTDTQHSFHQLLHQGTDIIPVDFIALLHSLNPIGDHHKILYANCLAQSQALLQGKTLSEARDELIAKGMSKEEAETLAPHKVMPGNRPSNTIILEKLTPKSLGALIALYEHKVFVQGIIWNINSFDQWGVELGKQLATKLDPALSGKKTEEALDSSTQGLAKLYTQNLKDVTTII